MESHRRQLPFAVRDEHRTVAPNEAKPLAAALIVFDNPLQQSADLLAAVPSFERISRLLASLFGSWHTKCV
ncbi:hypothetical protein D3C71_1972560 [compost metagenome]